MLDIHSFPNNDIDWGKADIVLFNIPRYTPKTLINALRTHLKAKGYKYGPETRAAEKVHSSLKRYVELPEDEKEQNRSNVRDIPNKLASVGYIILPASSNETPSKFSGAEINKLAEMEHERWMKERIDTGWKFAKRTNKAKKLHKDLVPWHNLHPSEQEKDRSLVIGISRILAKAGYTMVKLG